MGALTTWSNEVARWEQDGTRLVLTAVVLEDSARKLRGVKVDLSSENAKEQVYLDEQAMERTRLALVEISDAVALTEIGLLMEGPSKPRQIVTPLPVVPCEETQSATAFYPTFAETCVFDRSATERVRHVDDSI
jgi:hypothetical protein